MGCCQSKGRYTPLLRGAPLAIIMLAGVLLSRSLSQPASPAIQVFAGTDTSVAAVTNGTGTVNLGQTLQAAPSPQTFTVLNSGSANLVLAEPITLPPGFTLLRSFGSLTLGPGESTTFVVALNAGDAASYGGPLTFANNDPVNSSFSFALSGGVTPFPALRIVDDTDPGFSTVGQWTQSPGVGFQGGLTYISSGTGTNTASWTFSGLVPGQYRVSATWNADPSAADNTPFTVQDGSTVLATYTVDQTMAPSTFIDASQAWQDLGSGVYPVTSGSLVVSVSDNADGNVFADAIRIERVGYPSSAINDTDPNNFSTAGATWQVVPGAGFQGGVTSAPAGSGTSTATWTFGNLAPGLYRVMATWPADPSQADNAPFTIQDGGTVVGTVQVNQQQAPAGLGDAATNWQDLGNIGFPITSGTLTVTLSDNADGTVVADAIRVERINYATTESVPDTVRFLEQAAWGPNNDAISQVQALGFRAWLDQQFDANATAPSSYPLRPLLAQNPTTSCQNNTPTNCVRDNYSMYPLQTQFFTNAFYGPDQLRQRVAWSMHKIMVVSGIDLPQSFWMAPYLRDFDQVDRDANNNIVFDHAFGNFRQLLYAITLNPAMGTYLNMATSTKTNPNENYAREIMQLFTIGLFQLNPDGTQVLDGNGNPIATYDQSVVTNMAKVFTGWAIPQVPGQPGVLDYINPMLLGGGHVENAAKHDFTPKVVLDGITIPARGATVANAYQDLNDALDIISNHHNVAPFLSQSLIQDLVTSNPSPGYVARVAAVFNLNRTNPYQMREVVRAILLDPEARGDVKTDPNYGHLREPVQFVVNICRAFNPKSLNHQSTSDGYLDPQTTAMGQDVFRPATVFSYFQPDNVLPGSATVLAPEFGILSSYSSLKRVNFVNQMTFASGIPVNAPNAPRGTSIDFTAWLPLAADPGTLTDAVGNLLLHGAMSSAQRTSVVNAVAAVDAGNALKRVRTAVYLVASSSQYQVAQ